MVEALDFFTNLQQVSLATLCDDSFHELYLASWSVPFAWGWPIVDLLHLNGCLAVWVVVAYCVLMWYAYVEGKTTFSLVANLTHVLGFRYVLSDDHFTVDSRETLWFGVAHVVLTVPVLYLQTSLFANAFDFTGTKPTAMMLVSIMLSLGSVLITWGRAVASSRSMRNLGVLTVVLFTVFCGLVVLVSLSRVYFSYQCMDHVWTAINGCVWEEQWHGSGKYFGTRTVLPPVWDDMLFGAGHQHWHGLTGAHFNATAVLGYDPATHGPLNANHSVGLNATLQ